MNYRLLGFLVFLLFLFVVVVKAQTVGTVTLNVYNTTVWWSDTVVVNGSATYTNGSGFGSGLTANITLDGIQYCTNTTNGTGFYNCAFSAPIKLGSYTLQVNVTNSTGSSVTNTTTLSVKPNFGQAVVGKRDRSVFEVPMLIQDMNGEIRRIWTRVTVWKA